MNGAASPAPVIPWWKSRTMLAAYAGLAIAVLDAASTYFEGGNLSWRTGVILVGSALAAWGRKNAKALIAGFLFGPAAEAPADPTPEDPQP